MKSHILLFLAWVCLRSVSGQAITVTLLGTGAPIPSVERFGPSTLVETGGQYFLFDCGRGATQRLWQQKIPLGKVNQVFLTHLHSDHIVGLPDLWLTGWKPIGRRAEPLDLYGPTATVDLAEGLKQAFDWDIGTRSQNANTVDSGVLIRPHILQEGVIYNRDGVEVIAFRVDHGDLIDEAYGFRLNYQGRSVVISGDTRYNENLIRHAKGADVLIHEVVLARPEVLESSATARQIQNLHTPPEDAGRVFAAVAPRLAVYTHIIQVAADPKSPPPNVQELIPRTRTQYSGPLEIGEDLMVIEIGEEVIIKKPQ